MNVQSEKKAHGKNLLIFVHLAMFNQATHSKTELLPKPASGKSEAD